MSFTWQNGRQMKTFSQGDTSAIYIYNGEGQRIAKSVNGNRTDYVLDAGGTILAERKKGVAIRYLFDEAGKRIGFVWGSEKDLETLRTYYYVFNGQGDVIALVDGNGVVQARYTYDMWGKLLSVTDASGTAIPESNWTHAGHLNSFRYRGYYYDTESGLYFLNTRSYDPTTGRFINADGVIGAEAGVMNYNLFSYCANNPINFVDPTGKTLTGLNNEALQRLLDFNDFKDPESEKDYDHWLYDSYRNNSHKGPFRERAFGIQGNNPNFNMDLEDGGVSFGLGDYTIYGYQAGYEWEHFNVQGNVGTASAAFNMGALKNKNGEIGIDLQAKATAISGEVGTTFNLFGKEFHIALQGELLSVGAKAEVTNKKIGISLGVGYVGGGLSISWDDF